VCGWAAALRPALAQAPDPFAPGLRWVSAPLPGQAWIPACVALGASDGLGWAAEGGANPRFDLFAVPGIGVVPPLESASASLPSSGSLAVAAGQGVGALFALSQIPAPDAFHRRSEVARYDALNALHGAPFAPAWTHDMGLAANGPARTACDDSGAVCVAACWNDQPPFVRFDALDGAGGTLLARVDLAAPSLSNIALSGDGARAAISAGLDLWVLDMGGHVIAHSSLASATNAVCLSGDGRRLAVGGMGVLHVLDDHGSGYSSTFDVSAASNEIVACAALSRDARTLAIGWWNFVTGVSLRFEVWDIEAHALRFSQTQSGTPGGLQNLPVAARLTADGRRIAFACWGDGTPKPEVLLVDRDTALPVMQIDLPGSALALALDATGTRLMVGAKDSHANQFASTGAVRLYDTGEHDLQALSPAHIGGTLTLAARHPGASICMFLEGRDSPLPIHVAGTVGTLWLVRSSLSVSAKPADATGRADLDVGIPGDVSLIGAMRHFQAAFRVRGVLVFGEDVVHAVIL
jgi:hypothetical protein